MIARPDDTIEVVVGAVRDETPAIKVFDLVPRSGLLPAWEPGAHVDLHLPNGLTRSYSLIGPPGERRCYSIAVAQDRRSRGGSTFLHSAVSAGAGLALTPPRNHFPLSGEGLAVFIAGGIGITPLWCMIQQLVSQNRRWELFYAARARIEAAFVADLQTAAKSGTGRLHLWFDDENGGGPADLTAFVAGIEDTANIYCCGPVPMLQAFETLTRGRPADRVHVEYFQAPDRATTALPPLRACTVELARRGIAVEVPAGSSILDALMMQGIDVPYSCYEGLCGTCETRVLAGIPDHRDNLLTPKARAANDVVIICCSGSKTAKLVLDI